MWLQKKYDRSDLQILLSSCVPLTNLTREYDTGLPFLNHSQLASIGISLDFWNVSKYGSLSLLHYAVNQARHLLHCIGLARTTTVWACTVQHDTFAPEFSWRKEGQFNFR